MKRLTVTVLLLAICLNMLSLPAVASSINVVPTRSRVVLSEGSADVALEALAGGRVESSDTYITNTQKIKISLKSSKSITVKVSLHRNDGTCIQEATKDLGTIFRTSWTFSNLSQSEAYYFTITNLGQRDVSITGKVSE